MKISIKFAKTNQKIAEIIEICENYSILFNRVLREEPAGRSSQHLSEQVPADDADEQKAFPRFSSAPLALLGTSRYSLDLRNR